MILEKDNALSLGLRIVKGKTHFKDIQNLKHIYLYAGDLPKVLNYQYFKFVGLSLNKSNYRHINHDITQKHELEANTVDIYQAEDVFEHIQLNKIGDIINDIYRILKPGGLFRLSVPDYRCNLIYNRSKKDKYGNVVFDPGGGGMYINKRVVDGGHVWFPKYELVRDLIEQSPFKKYRFLHYYDANDRSITKKINYKKAYIMRTPDNSKDIEIRNPYRALSIVVDCYK